MKRKWYAIFALFFCLPVGLHGQQIQLVQNLSAVIGSDYEVVESVEAGGLLYFSTYGDDNGTSLWASDGNHAWRLYSWPEKLEYALNKLYALGDKIIFTAVDSAHGKELWISDGTNAGTHMIKDINPGPVGTFYAFSLLKYSNIPIQSFVVSNGMAYFCAGNTPTTNNQLWQTDGTAAGTVMIPDVINLRPPFNGFGPSVNVVGNRLLLSYIQDGGKSCGRILTDGTATGTRILDSSKDFYYEPIWPYGGKAFMSYDGRWGFQISDGTANGTIVFDSLAAFDMTSEDTCYLGGVFYYLAGGLYRTDGTLQGTFPVKEWSGRSHSSPLKLRNRVSYPTVFNNRIYFCQADTIYQSDGTPGGTSPMIQLINDSSYFTRKYASQLTALNSRLFFRAIDTSRVELYMSDGTAEGTKMIPYANADYVDSSFDNRLASSSFYRYKPFSTR